LPDLSSDIVEILEKIGIDTISGVLGANEDKITGPDGLSKESMEIVYNTIQSFLTEEKSNDSQNENMESRIGTTEEEVSKLR
jgi:hypothetical protein